MVGKGQLDNIRKKNKIQIDTQFIYLWLNKNLIQLPGTIMLNKETKQPEEFLSKDTIVQVICDMLNEMSEENIDENDKSEVDNSFEAQ